MALSKEQLDQIRALATKRSQGRTSEIKAAQSGSDNAKGGFSVEDALSGVANAVHNASAALSDGFIVGNAKSGRRAAAISADVTVAVHAESPPITASDATFSRVDLALGGSYISQTVISNELLENAYVGSIEKMVANTASKIGSSIDVDFIGGLTGDVDTVAAGVNVSDITLANLEAWLGSLDELDRSPVIYCGHKVASKLRSLVNANEDRILGHSIKVTRAFGSPSTGQVAAAVGYLDKKLAVEYDPASPKQLKELLAENDQTLLCVTQRAYGGELDVAGNVWSTLTLA